MMKKRIRGIAVFLCVLLLAIPAGALNASLDGRWISLQYGALTFHQAGNAFTAVWSGANASGTISGQNASFRFWSGASFEKCADDSRGYGTLTLSDDGNTLNGSWANLSRKEPESGSFTALRLSSINGFIPQETDPEPEETSGMETTETSPAPTGMTQVSVAGSLQSGTEPPGNGSGIETETVPNPSDELTLLPDDLPPEHTGPIAEVISDLEASVLKLFDFFDNDSDNVTDTVPIPAGELNLLPENLPVEYGSELLKFLNDIENGVLKFFDIFD